MTHFANQFMIAMPGLQDPGFSRTVSIICEHNEQGALGLVLNRPSDINVGELLAQMDLTTANDQLAAQAVLHGGPVSRDRGFVLHEERGPWESTMSVSPDLQLTTSRDILEAMANGEGPTRAVMTVGYAGWSAGQLEEEMTANSWLSADYSSDILFNTPVEQRWSAATALLGIDPHQITGEAGHA